MTWTRTVKTSPTLRVLVTKSEMSYSALALDMDVWGFGQTIENACAALKVNLRAIISFAFQFDCINIIQRIAPDDYFEKYYTRLYMSKLSRLSVNETVQSMSFPDIDVDDFIPATTPMGNLVVSGECLELHQLKDNQDISVLSKCHVDGAAKEAYPLCLDPQTRSLHPGQLPVIARRLSIPLATLQQQF